MLGGRLLRGSLSSPSALSSSNRNSTTAGASDTACPISMTTFRECTVHLQRRRKAMAQLLDQVVVFFVYYLLELKHLPSLYHLQKCLVIHFSLSLFNSLYNFRIFINFFTPELYALF